LYKSIDGLTWEEVVHFSGMNCLDMVFWDNHYAVSVADNLYGVHYSNNNGLSWIIPPTGCPNFSDMSYRIDSTLFGVFPGVSDSSGLWSSTDFGFSWQFEFYSELLSCVNSDMNGYTFVGWEENSGVARWVNGTLIPMNEGLQDLSINNLFVSPIMSAIHIMAFTDRGAFRLNDYQTSTENVLPKSEITLSNYPNPFNPTTRISFELNTAVTAPTELIIYNIKGQKLKNIPFILSEVEGSVLWDGTDQSNQPVSSGIYYYKLNIPNSPVKKMVLLK